MPEALRRGYEEGRSVHGPLALSYEAFAARAMDLTRRRLERLGGPPAPAEVDEALARAALGDLFLAVACEEGTPGAWERFTAAFGRTLVALAIRRGASSAEAEDLAREIPGELFTPPPRGGCRTRLGTFDGAGSLTGWLAVIVQRRLADRRRAAARTAPGEGPERADRSLPDPADTAADAETALLLGEALREGWATLTDREALALLLRIRDGVPQVDIARILGVGEPRVSRMISGASEKLRACVVRRIGRDAPRDSPGLERAVAGFLATLPSLRDPFAHE